jgi:NADP-dependent 3-hydroxy acid dehydrogenase YdfG
MLEEALMIKQRVIAITGASSGIGRATALHLAQYGGSVVLAARSEEGLTKLVEEIRANGGSATYCVTDVRKRDDLLRLISTAATTYGRLDVLVSNAGAMPIGPIGDLAVDDWEQMVDVNIKGVLYGIAAALPLFRSQGFGISSILPLPQPVRRLQIKLSIPRQRPQFWPSLMVCGKSWPVKSA